MDSLTHVLMGAAVGLSIAKPELRRKAAFIGALACTVPDLDVFIHSDSDPMLSMEVHRSFSHSLIGIPLGGVTYYRLIAVGI